MQTPGTVFVAVGAGHLAGKDSVLVRLAERGITIAPRRTDPVLAKLAFPSAPALGRALPGHGHPWRRGGVLLNRRIAK